MSLSHTALQRELPVNIKHTNLLVNHFLYKNFEIFDFVSWSNKFKIIFLPFEIRLIMNKLYVWQILRAQQVLQEEVYRSEILQNSCYANSPAWVDRMDSII